MFQFTQPQSPLRDAITSAYRLDEVTAVSNLLATLQFDDAQKQDINALARRLITQVRADRSKSSGVDALMQEFSLSSEEGVALMCLAESLLRIPDTATRDRLIQDKLADGDWKGHVGNSPSMFVNAAAWGLVLTGKLTQPTNEGGLGSALTRVLQKGGAPFIRAGVNHAMKILGKQFVTGQTITEALANGKEREKSGYRFSFDMLGEAAMTQEDADRYYQDYVTAIHAIGKDAAGRGVYDGNGISVKLSAIHPRYFRAQHERVMTELLPRLKALYMLAKEYNIGLNIDAEEANRLELSLDLMESLVSDPDLAGFNGIGFVVQAYQKRCPYVIDFLIDLARRNNQKLMIRLVKGAYWDSEIKWAQVDGMDGYPVYTRKVHTDVSYLACAKKLLAAQDAIFPQFATHNAQSLATIYEMGKDKEFEFQCLHGMGETLYDQVVGEKNLGRRVRIYAPVGTHKTLLAYLVRRLLENGANSSFVNRIVDEDVSIDELIESPIDVVSATGITPNPLTPAPRRILGERDNSNGLDLSNEHVLAQLQTNMQAAAQIEFNAASLTTVSITSQAAHAVQNPADHRDIVGQVSFIDAASVPNVITAAIDAQSTWQAASPAERAVILRRFADLMEEPTRMALLMMVAVREAGKTLLNSIAEVREAVDFCRYYADETERLNLNSPVGTVVAISPWNFPLAIFVGEVVSALAAGNTVVAKPAEQTSLIAHLAVSWLHEAGVPANALQLVLGAGDVGAALTSDERIDGVIFTGSTDVAKRINKLLAARSDNPVLIAETGGMNAMIVDSTALPEQVCLDVLASAFDSAGQRCSALRILCVQEDIADHMVEMIKGAMDELVVNNPAALATDVGPVIDAEAQENLLNHINNLKQIAPYHEVAIKSDAPSSTFVAPIMFELKDLSQLKKEVFGPVLHVVRFAAHELDDLIDNINKKGFALTHGIHSRIDNTIEHIASHIEAGNVYINRNIVGAVVGVQPFGGHAMSGTGPKAGGPFYLQRLSKLSTWNTPALDKAAEINEAALAKVSAVAAKLGLNSNEQAAFDAAVKTARATSLNHGVSTLAGPTGEANTLSWHAPKSVAIYGGDKAQSIAALAQLAVNGTRAQVCPAHALADYVNELQGVLEVVEQPAADNNDIIIALSAMPCDEQVRLAGLDGAIRRVIDATNGLDFTRLYHEVSQSYNTTAAGGNASLMASA
ncbi:bifunctional proline dehydrogenase/L-glutamate gamma-semialdehyde dehydrogenase PutA [Moraxella sp. FZLJ2107]|uniref:bifunctional proline dehydrogenase/L-glutamate gamma-semialdehyde dehydrogenase PutA n=1 Tax=unclassified Moraxella TaxID=2685852 RepID=UPI0020C8D70D|nr:MULTISPECIES: bifunctional proline dehydrogenase/L-glutamate gamma-semialdehyde dehydrogenase PutA [unclassified Moraxella]UTO05357.1 bifunctional proline dehydrogenase/L-glutamate gamma-semialdehyde dehydrogenase PutA [Moraxella sp. FZLJ2107]UTO22092.1 bifunctional proline dehydrogenase/L-glutamate gamma-semialdehyde dehydrogenase PutA [Moraxella sp. FZLJ2109]